MGGGHLRGPPEDGVGCTLGRLVAEAAVGVEWRELAADAPRAPLETHDRPLREHGGRAVSPDERNVAGPGQVRRLERQAHLKARDHTKPSEPRYFREGSSAPGHERRPELRQNALHVSDELLVDVANADVALLAVEQHAIHVEG